MKEIHNHYHLWPKDPQGNWSCCVAVSIFIVCFTVFVTVELIVKHLGAQ